MDKVDSKKDARQVGLSNVSKLSTYQFFLQIYSTRKLNFLQRAVKKIGRWFS
ncbi:hypothetical protein K9P40_05285 [Lentilactobacillus otakiensis]|uniref:hypothetical protein n=1 Tax=Lentilactobacillus otakiensis TaxID=481720 RepID=UPI001CBDB58A|nr:hypothetical protein [Lentilactobacillus otakiensis]MBZ3776489.1 hypothetical protein [Lentilactobacillus otakiensis]